MQKTFESYNYVTLIIAVILCVSTLSGCKLVNHLLASSSTIQKGDDASSLLQTTPPVLDKELIGQDNITISQIQGQTHFSAFANQKVQGVHGIVTVIRADGFYLQSTYPDDDPATSEGIYVYQGLVPKVKPGDEVLVSGMVRERVLEGDSSNDLTITHISEPFVEVLSKSNPLPAPIIIGEGGRKPPTEVIDGITNGRISKERPLKPENAGLDFFESLEGMLVQVNQAVVVGATNRYKEIVVLPDNGSWAGIRSLRGGVVIQENDFNPERVILDDALLELPFVQVGDLALVPIIGVMDYAFGNYKLLPIEKVQFSAANLQPSEALQAVEPGQIRIASYNTEIISAKDEGRIVTLADQIVIKMGSPDIIGLQEVADNDGLIESSVVSADQTYQRLIEAIIDLGGPSYAYANIDPMLNQDGGAPGANIRVGFLYRMDRGLGLAEAPHGDALTATHVYNANGVPMLSYNPGRIEPEHNAFRNSRKPLVVMFILDNQPLYVINNHFISKGSDTSLFGANQPPLLSSEERRNEQAQVVQSFVASLLTINPESRVIVLGDLNDFQFSMPLAFVKGDNLTNLVETLPIAEQYTYVYDGNSQVLDHMLVSEALMNAVASVNILHLNSEFDYMRQFSDHDPVTATFWWNPGD